MGIDRHHIGINQLKRRDCRSIGDAPNCASPERTSPRQPADTLLPA